LKAFCKGLICANVKSSKFVTRKAAQKESHALAAQAGGHKEFTD